jgi:pimeloyl-ACP methyl ester carboxylesterase
VDEGVKVPPAVFAAALGRLLSVDYTDQLKTITVPTVIFWGDKDAFCLAADQDRLVKNIRYARKIVYRETGHGLHWEKPQAFAEDLSKFLHDLENNGGSY